MGEEVSLRLNSERRLAIMRNHTAAHLLQAALRKVLGDHVEQAGQLVNEFHVRFDFTHFSALTLEEIQKVEELVNQEILKGVPVDCREMPIEEARKLGAMALFGEKYGDIVRVVSVDDSLARVLRRHTYSEHGSDWPVQDLLGILRCFRCGAAVEGVTGYGVLRMLNDSNALIHSTAAVMKVNNPAEIGQRAAQMALEIKERDAAIDSLNNKIASMRMDGLFANAHEIEGLKIITALFSGTEAAALRTMCDKIREQAPNVVAVLACTNNGKGQHCRRARQGSTEQGPERR